MKVKIETKGRTWVYDVDNYFQAVKAFFRDVKDGKITLDEVGLIGFWVRSDGEKIPFRIPTTLYKMNMISFETLRLTLQQIADFTDDELMEMVRKDSWMAEWR